MRGQGFDEPATGGDRGRGFLHKALLYSSTDEFLASAVPFIREGLEAGEPVLVATDPGKIGLIHDALGADGEGVRFADMENLGRNPAVIIAAWKALAAEGLSRGSGVRGIGEPVWPGRTPAELEECHLHEALLNLAFDGHPDFTLICPYDTSGLAPEVIDAARCTHPLLIEAGTERESETFSEPERPLDGRLPEPERVLAEMSFSGASLPKVRRFVAELARDNDLDERSTADLQLAVTEVATNSARHGGGLGSLRLWREPGALVCEVRDDGHIQDALAGRERPVDSELRGRGLWLINNLCDLVQIRSSPEGSVIRMYMTVASGAADRPA